MIDHTHDPTLRSWVESANQPDSDFPIQNLPFVMFRRGPQPHVGVAIGDQVLDVTAALQIPSLISVMSMSKAERVALRGRISAVLLYPALLQPASHLIPMADAELLLPCEIGDFTDFYASIHHATNVGSMFRPANPLLPNYKWLPVGYHGRASSVVLSGTPVRRPWGQTAIHSGPPAFIPSRCLDYELELGAFLGPGNALHEPIPPSQAGDHLFGICLLNDWSARDLQSWESQPLGPFLSKSFATSISPWVVTVEALEPFRRAPLPRPVSDPQPLPHLQTEPDGAFAITLEVWLRSAQMSEPVRVSRGNFAEMYWTFSQMVAHHASNGCPLRPGDLIGSGTVSGPDKENRGCLLELTWQGRDPLELPSGEIRRFLEDGDEVTLRGYCEAPGFRRIGLGECRGKIAPAAPET
jgi:fumarylacetoacetase